jgi:hypothetical protein
MGKLVDLRAYRRFRNSLEKHLAAYLHYRDPHRRDLVAGMAVLAAREFGVRRMSFPRCHAAVVDGYVKNLRTGELGNR